MCVGIRYVGGGFSIYSAYLSTSTLTPDPVRFECMYVCQ